jgi:phage terminase large subunit-like protein
VTQARGLDADLAAAGLQAMLERLQDAPTPRSEFVPLPHQIPPPWEDESWDVWLMLAGRGTGKTAAAAHILDRLMSEHRGWQSRIIAPTVRDARECVLGATGLKAINPRVQWKINEASVFWPNGSRCRLYGAFTPEDVERLRAGGNSHFDWYEELAAWPKLDETWQQASFGLRLGAHPRAIVTTTPKPKDRLRKLIADVRTRITKASTRDNPHLSEGVRRRLYEEYEGTRLGRQELEGQLLDDIEGALWSTSMIEPYRVPEAPELVKTIVAIDPAKTRRRESDLTGILVVGRGVDAHGYVLADLSGRYSPAQWAARAIWAYDHYQAAYVIAETNIAGELVTQVLRDADDRVPVRGVRSRQSKMGRALPLVGLYEQGRMHHVGLHAALEDQMLEFTGSGDSAEADDRVDALVIGAAELHLIRETVERRGWRAYA